MKWSSVKNILLGMLIAINLFLISTLTYKQIKTENIPPEVISAAVEVLENSGITCDEALLPQKYMTAKSLSVSFNSPAELSHMFFGSQLAFQTDGRRLIARSGEAELIIEDEAFSYSAGTVPSKATEKQLRRALKALGLNMKNGVYSEKYNIFCCYWDGIPLFGMYVRAELDADGELCSVEARWPEIYSDGGSASGLTVMSCLPYFGKAFGGSGAVERIRFGYSLSKNAAADIYTLSPAWKVTMTDGRRLVFAEEM